MDIHLLLFFILGGTTFVFSPTIADRSLLRHPHHHHYDEASGDHTGDYGASFSDDSSSENKEADSSEPDDRYVPFYLKGEQTGECKNYLVRGEPDLFTKFPARWELYGPHDGNIKYLNICPVPVSGRHHGVFSVAHGGVGSHFALIHFKTPYENETFTFNARVCW